MFCSLLAGKIALCPRRMYKMGAAINVKVGELYSELKIQSRIRLLVDVTKQGSLKEDKIKSLSLRLRILARGGWVGAKARVKFKVDFIETEIV